MITSVKFKGAENVLQAVNIFNRSLMAKLADAVDDTSKNVRNRTRQAAPVRTGKYKSKIRRVVDKTRLSADVGPKLGGKIHPLGHLLEGGVAPHPIHPYGNKRVTVTHPGIKAQPHLEPAWESEQPKFITACAKALQEAGK